MTTVEAVVLAVVEGLTEFLPVSSTGHMILTESLMKMQRSTLTNVFIVNIQFGAILSVLFLYRKRFFQGLNFYLKLFVGFIPAGICGYFLNDKIDRLLSSVFTVAVSLVIGGIALIVADIIFRKQIENIPIDEDLATFKEPNEFGIEVTREVQLLNVTWLQSFIIGLFQPIAMLPGVSRSAITIIGGLTQKFSIKKAAEFSFFLGVPTISVAATYKLVNVYDMIKGQDIDLLILGNVVSFIVGMLAIRFFLDLIAKYGLKFFGYYRIALGVTILVLMALGHKLDIN